MLAVPLHQQLLYYIIPNAVDSALAGSCQKLIFRSAPKKREMPTLRCFKQSGALPVYDL